MYLANLLHFYQPANQQPDILDAVVHQSYLPVLQGIYRSKNSKITLNVTGALLELFDKYKYFELLDLLKKCVKEGKIELTGSSKYHAFLPLIPIKEVRRQIELNTATLKHYLGDGIELTGFFPPELGYFDELLPIVKDLGFKWILLDEISYDGGLSSPSFNTFYKDKSTDLSLFFRDRRSSNLIMSAVVRNTDSLLDALKGDFDSKNYLITAMDGETFGHHRPGLETLLFDLFDDSRFKLKTISDLYSSLPKVPIEKITPVCATWASSVNDIEKGIQFISWLDKENPIHTWQWEFVNFVLDEFYAVSSSNEKYEYLRQQLDRSLASDHFWWASAKPWWSLEMIEDGAFRLLSIIKDLPNVTPEKIARAQNLYTNIISTAFEWQRTGKIREMAKSRNESVLIPFKERTLEKGGSEQGIYNAFLDMMRDLEQEAVKNHEYEKAILWRDAIYKIETKNDIYDAIHAVDLLRQYIPYEKVEKTLDEYTAIYKNIRGGQPEQRS
jgi:hypothetical protein